MSVWNHRRYHQELIHQPSKPSTHKRSNPVHPVVPPPPPDERRAESPGWIHRRPIKRTTGQNIRSHDESNGQRRNGPKCPSPWVDRRGVDRVDQSERHDDLEQDCMPQPYTRRDRESKRFLQSSYHYQIKGTHACLVFARQYVYHASRSDPEEERSHDGTEDLRDPVEDGMDEGDPPTDEGAEGDSRVDVTAGDVEGNGDGDEEGEGVGNGHHNQTAGGGGFF